MKRVLSVALIMLSLGVVAAAQTSMTPGLQNAPARKSPLSLYAGSWIGMFQGHAWITIKLNEQAGAISGTLERPRSVNFQDSGELKSVSDERVTDGVQNAVLQGDGLLLTVKDPESNEIFHYVMRLMSVNTAELKMSQMAMQPGMAKPRPWMLSRVGPNAVTPVR
jgi:hypothetical protein